MTCSSSELKATADLSSAAQSPPPTFEAGGSGAEALLIVFALAAFALGAGYCFYLSAEELPTRGIVRSTVGLGVGTLLNC